MQEVCATSISLFLEGCVCGECRVGRELIRMANLVVVRACG